MRQLTAFPRKRAPIVRDLPSFLTRHGAEVLDVTRGVAPGTRRLVVGRRDSPEPIQVIAVANHEECGPAIDKEARHLSELRILLRPSARATLPEILGPVEVSGLPGLVMTAVPGMPCHTTQRPRRVTADESAAVLRWLETLWQDTAGTRGEVGVGRDALDDLLARYAGAAGLASTLGAIQRARARLASYSTPRTMSHGCLCPGHVFIRDGEVHGVDDWGGSEVQSEPLRDLGGWLVRSAGVRLATVVTARTAYDRALREFVVAGLAVWGIPPVCWRDLLLLVHAEIAVDGLRAGDVGAMDLLTKVSLALPRGRGRDGGLS